MKYKDISGRASRLSSFRVVTSALLVIYCVFSTSFAGSQSAQTQKKRSNLKLDVKIAIPKAKVRSGESVLLRLQIRNQTTENTYIGTSFDDTDNALTRLYISILRDGSWVSASTQRSAADYFEYAPDRKPPLIEKFSKYWLALPPGHSYGGDFVLEPSSYKWLNRPGKYVIRGTYVSDGFQNAGMNNPLASYVDELSRLPYKPFVGEVETNQVSLEVVPPKS